MMDEPHGLTMAPFAPDEVLFVLDESVSFGSDPDATLDRLDEVLGDFGGALDKSSLEPISFDPAAPRGVPLLPARRLNASTYHEAYQMFVELDKRLRAEVPSVIWQPNWLIGASGNGVGGGGSGAGPGARPIPLKAGEVRWRRAVLDPLRERARGGGKVRLIFLDTWNSDLGETERHLASLPLYRLLNNHFRDADVPATVQAMRNDDPDPFPMPDHGLFAAYLAGEVIGRERLQLHDSVLGTFAPEEVELLAQSAGEGGVSLEAVRVLNEFGGGDVLRLIAALHEIADSVQPGERVIVNMSLVLNIPDNQDKLPEVYQIPRAVREHFEGRWPWQPYRSDRLDRGLYDAIQRLRNQGVLLVAAAGNNSQGEALRLDARFPAAYDEVLGVTAATVSGEQEAWYANRVQAGGVALFAGDVREGVVDGESKMVLDERYPLVGPFSNSAVPTLGVSSDPPNESGWVAWAGTSFATPLASGLAALLWSASPDQDASEVANALRSLAPSSLASGTPYIDLFEW